MICVLVLLAMSCADQPTPSETSAGTYKSCEGFIDSNMIENLTGIVGLIERAQALDSNDIPGLAESGAVNNCIIEVFRTVGSTDEPSPGDSLAIQIVQFEQMNKPSFYITQP